MSGPDHSKVGTDFSVTLGVIMCPKSKKVAVAAPQVPQANEIARPAQPVLISCKALHTSSFRAWGENMSDWRLC